MSNYLDWQSNLSADTVFQQSDEYRYPHFWQDGIVYLTSLKQQSCRSVINYLRAGSTQCLTPPSFDLKNKINEYGGKPFWLFEDTLFFVNAADQCVYRQCLPPALKDLANEAIPPQRISPAPSATELLMYTDVVPLADNLLLAIVEKKNVKQGKNHQSESFIALLSVSGDPSSAESKLQILQGGADFYSNLVINVSQKKVAWVQWNHPNMPWDSNQLWYADLSKTKDGVAIENAQVLALANSASVCQLMFSSRGELYFSADFSGYNDDDSKNYWNIYSADFSQAESMVTQITFDQCEYGYPHWQYGDVRIAELDNNTVLSFATSPAGDQLCKINQTTRQVTKLPASKESYQHLAVNGQGSACAVVLSEHSVPNLGILSPSAKRVEKTSNASTPILNKDLSLAESIAYPTRDGAIAYGYYYAPCNSAYTQSGEQGQPPLIVMVHGGPTARAYGYFDVQKQFWTQRGFAVLDVNHRGSTGYGRAYRDSLYGEWGEMDTADIIDAIDYLVANDKVDAAQVCIRGKSAGGYTVLRALTQYPKVFRAGACYYGIGNLASLAASTHKFEKFYTDHLIGETFSAPVASQTDSRYWQRSPIKQINRLQSAMIVFQGVQDKIVPPQVAHELISALKKRGLAHSYVEYQDEGHGFRQTSNCIDALTQELNFYRECLR